MYIHPELGVRLAQINIEQARSRAQRASLLRAAALEERASGGTAGARRHGWSALTQATVARSRAWRRSLRASAPRTTKG